MSLNWRYTAVGDSWDYHTTGDSVVALIFIDGREIQLFQPWNERG